MSAAELLDYRDAFPHGKYEVAIEPSTFSLRAYNAFLRGIWHYARGIAFECVCKLTAQSWAAPANSFAAGRPSMACPTQHPGRPTPVVRVVHGLRQIECAHGAVRCQRVTGVMAFVAFTRLIAATQSFWL